MDGLVIFLTVMVFLGGLGLTILLAVYITKTGDLSKKVNNLQLELTRLKSMASSNKPEEPKVSKLVVSAPPVIIAQVEPKPVEKVKAEEHKPLSNLLGVLPESIQPVIPLPEVLPPAREEPVIKKSRTRAEWEALIGGKWLNWIGAVALIIGMGFFLKYAFDKNWINETMRVLMGGLVGFGLIVGGAYFRKKSLEIFSQGLVGAGISILYLSVYASFNFYHLVSQVTAFVLMSIVSAIAFSLALKYSSLAVSLLGWLGGFLTPILLSTGQANEIGLFTYIALLDFGILAVVFKKDDWVILEPLTFIATYLMYIIWYSKYYTSDNLFITALFIGIFWGLFYALDVFRIIKSKYTFPVTRQVIASLNAFLYYLAMYMIINPQNENLMALITFMTGVIYLVTILMIKRRNPTDKMIMPRYILTSIVLLVVATIIQFSGFTVVSLWAIEAFILVWCGINWKLRYVWVAGLSLFAISLIKLFVTENAFTYSPIDRFQFIFNQRALAFVILAAMCGASSILFKRLEEEIGRAIQLILHYSWTILIFILLTVEINDLFSQLIIKEKDPAYLEFLRMIILSGSWMLYSLPLVWAGLWRNVSAITYSGIAFALVSVFAGCAFGYSFNPAEKFKLLINIRAIILIFLIIGLLVHIWWLKNKQQSYDWIKVVTGLFYCLCSIVFFVLCTFETNDCFRKLLSGANGAVQGTLEYNRGLVLAIVWIIYSILLVGIGFMKNLRSVFYPGLAAAMLAVLVGAIQGCSFHSITQFTPVINIRFATLVILIIGLFVLTRLIRNKHQLYSWIKPLTGVFYCLSCIIFFVLVTCETNDYFKKLLNNAPDTAQGVLSYNRALVLPIIWIAYSVCLVGLGFAKKLSSVFCPGFIAGILAILGGAIAGFSFYQIEQFIPVINIRALALAILIIGSIIHVRWLFKKKAVYNWSVTAFHIVKVVIILLILDLITVETIDYFEKTIWHLTHNTVQSDTSKEISRLQDTQQLALSGVWLLYSIVLIIIGIWQRMPWLRISAMIFFGITILKIFIYDLSFLETLYRIFSFIGLGLILLLVSYLYHRFKSVIFGMPLKKD
jgi:uncharacterized membrane protein